jgi:hypothetical protein
MVFHHMWNGDMLNSSSRPHLYASAAEDACAELARAQRNAEALDQLNAPFDTYLECEAMADARRVGRALRRLSVERRIVTHPRAKTGWDSELKVINQIAHGATPFRRHRTAPFPHTMKTHVHNAFAVLGVTSRSKLAQLMGRADY